MTRFALAVSLFLAALCSPALAQAPKEAPAYEPTSGQEGKDVVWVPTPQAVVNKMLDLAKVGPKDFVMDLGSGDGRTVITAAKRGAKALGVEFNPDMVALSQRNAEKAGVAGRAEFMRGDLFEADLSKATVITMFLLPDINLKLRPKILGLKPGTRIASNTFTMGDWEPDAEFTVGVDEGCDTYWCTALLWIVPAKAAGKHRLPQGELVLKQSYQKLSGTLTESGRTVAVKGTVRGEEVSFTANGREYHGRMSGGRLELH